MSEIFQLARKSRLELIELWLELVHGPMSHGRASTAQALQSIPEMSRERLMADIVAAREVT